MGVTAATRRGVTLSNRKPRHNQPPTETMGKLNIAHHRSYYPYRSDNIERFKRDEEARQKENREEGRMRFADPEARLDLLRGRSGSKKARKKDEDKIPEPQPVPTLQSISISSGHINPFAEIEQISEDLPEEKRMKDLSWKAVADPLASINSQLLSRTYTSTSSSSSAPRIQAPANTTEARIHRESSGQAQAMERIRKRSERKNVKP
ncbi:hypothetical protein M422DRAFT_256322 [Sphaerobolus stellatus SS14]|uniref:Uncharacterized protein n=1 Tax=Sphaerobolus stellatus (strain SS14) TaxID=990650 RepID=A0A0C9VGS6_SPHS4|nr:hypothetical protein M422DRAFT_256322 [Sphaerobolus stellatus SS14]